MGVVIYSHYETAFINTVSRYCLASFIMGATLSTFGFIVCTEIAIIIGGTNRIILVVIVSKNLLYTIKYDICMTDQRRNNIKTYKR